MGGGAEGVFVPAYIFHLRLDPVFLFAYFTKRIFFSGKLGPGIFFLPGPSRKIKWLLLNAIVHSICGFARKIHIFYNNPALK